MNETKLATQTRCIKSTCTHIIICVDSHTAIVYAQKRSITSAGFKDQSLRCQGKTVIYVHTFTHKFHCSSKVNIICKGHL